MIECPVKDQQPQQVPQGQALIVAGVPTQREVEQNGQGVQLQELFHHPVNPGPVPVPEQGPGENKVAGDHEEEGHRQPSRHPGEEKIPGEGEGSERRGVDGHHQKGRPQAESVKTAAAFPGHLPPSVW